MPQAPFLMRWRLALTQAARRTLGARWRSAREALAAAQVEYRALYGAAVLDARTLRKAAQRVHDLERLCTVLARELRVRVSPMSPE